MLARLSEIEGVDNSFANEPGSVVGLSLLPGADPGKVAREVQRTLSEEATQRGTAPPHGEEAAPLRGREAAAALQQEQWHDREEVARRAAEILAAEDRASASGFPWLLLVLLLLCAAAIAWAWRRRRAASA